MATTMVAHPDQGIGVGGWSQACAWLRENPGPDLAWAAFAMFFPGVWRGESNYAPLKASLMKLMLGPDWYARVYEDPTSLWLPPDRFEQWRRDPVAMLTVRANLAFCADQPELLKTLSGQGWAKLLQAASDFSLIQDFQRIWNLAAAANLQPHERALLHLTY